MTDDEAPGWDSIEAAFGLVYPSAVHVAPGPPPELGGVLSGMSAYRGEAHWHFVSFGLTDLFHKTGEPVVGINESQLVEMKSTSTAAVLDEMRAADPLLRTGDPR